MTLEPGVNLERTAHDAAGDLQLRTEMWCGGALGHEAIDPALGTCLSVHLLCVGPQSAGSWPAQRISIFKETMAGPCCALWKLTPV